MTTRAVPTRTIDGIELPAAGTWTIDPGHTELAFVGRHFMLTRIRGRFVGVEGAVVVGDDPAESTIEVQIDMTSVDSGDQARDDHLRSPDFFDVDQWPTATFRSSAVTWTGDEGEVAGDLTIRDVTHPVTLTVTYLGHVLDPWDNDRAVFSAKAVLDREDWGLTWNMPLANGGLVVSKRIELEINVETVRQV